MTKKITKNGFLLVFLLLGFAVNLDAQTRLAGFNDPTVAVASGQSEIIINAENADRDIAVWINGTIVAHLRPKTRERIIVHNGQNLVEVADTQARGNNWNIGSKKSITVSSNSNTTIVGMTVRYGALVNLSIQGTTALGGGGAVSAPPPPAAVAVAPAPPPAPTPAPTPAPARNTTPARTILPSRNSSSASPIENAVVRAASVLMQSLPAGSTVAVLSMSSSDPDMADFVIEELAYLFVETRRYRVVDRQSLDALQKEVRFQYSGDVDDNSAVSIGRLLGANIVITGSLSGSGSTRRLRAKALNVQTAEIIAMASEAY